MVNHLKASLFRKLLDYYAHKLDIREKTSGYTVSGDDLFKLAADAYPRLAEYIKVYNECVDLIARLSPTLNTTVHLLIQKEFGKPLELLRIAQLYRVKDMVLQRL